MIRDRRLRGGETVVEQRLAETLGISRTPLREALQRLEGEGLVVKAANRSFVVRHVDLAEYLHSLKVREILEPEAAALAVGHIPMGRLHAIRAEAVELHAAATHTHEHWVSDDHVHRIYAAHCGNEVMARLIEGAAHHHTAVRDRAAVGSRRPGFQRAHRHPRRADRGRCPRGAACRAAASALAVALLAGGGALAPPPRRLTAALCKKARAARG
ncbi:GntR family transcriptional regulator [Teichococcus cervicalis]